MARELFAPSLICLILTLGLSTPARAATEIARVNQTVITAEQLSQKYQESLKYFQTKTPSKKAVLDELIHRELGVQEARKLGLDKEPDVQEKIHSVLFQALIERKLGKDFEKIEVSDSEAKELYSQYPDVRTSHIFVAVRPGASEAEEQAALARLKKIQDEELRPGSATFAEIAQRFSEGVAAPMGGDIDYQGREKLDPNYYKTALGLKTPGKVSGIVRTQFGYHIIKLAAIRPWSDVDKLAVKRQVFEKKRTELFDRYMKQLTAQAKISLKPGAPQQ